MILLAHYFPQLDIKNLGFEEFAEWSEAALWLHSQMRLIQQSNAMAMLGAGTH